MPEGGSRQIFPLFRLRSAVFISVGENLRALRGGLDKSVTGKEQKGEKSKKGKRGKRGKEEKKGGRWSWERKTCYNKMLSYDSSFKTAKGLYQLNVSAYEIQNTWFKRISQ